MPDIFYKIIAFPPEMVCNVCFESEDFSQWNNALDPSFRRGTLSLVYKGHDLLGSLVKIMAKIGVITKGELNKQL